jgi:WD40 repeat protein
MEKKAGQQASKEVLLSKTWAVQNSSRSSYTGGKVSLSHDHRFLACWNAENVSLLELSSGRVRSTITAGEDEGFTTFSIAPEDRELATASARSFLLKRWDMATGKLIKAWRGHQMPVRAAELTSGRLPHLTSGVGASTGVGYELRPDRFAAGDVFGGPNGARVERRPIILHSQLQGPHGAGGARLLASRYEPTRTALVCRER